MILYCGMLLLEDMVGWKYLAATHIKGSACRGHGATRAQSAQVCPLSIVTCTKGNKVDAHSRLSGAREEITARSLLSSLLVA